MKNILRTFALLFILSNNSCKAQQMVQTTKDAYLLKTSEQQFINKPLKNLLKEIKPEIKTAGASNEEGHQFFSLDLEPWNNIKKMREAMKTESRYMFM